MGQTRGDLETPEYFGRNFCVSLPRVRLRQDLGMLDREAKRQYAVIRGIDERILLLYLGRAFPGSETESQQPICFGDGIVIEPDAC